MEGFYILLGCAGMYSIVHYFILSFKSGYKERTSYEKVVSIFAIVFIGLLIFGIMLGE